MNMDPSCNIFYLYLTGVFIICIIVLTTSQGECFENLATDELRGTYRENWLNFSDNLPCKGDYNNDGKFHITCSAVDDSFEFDKLPVDTVILEVRCKGAELNITKLNLFRLEELTFDTCKNLQLNHDIFQGTRDIRNLSIKAAYDIADFHQILGVISQLHKLQLLSLSKSSGFKRLQRKDLALLNSTSLEELDVSDCHIEAVDRDAFDDLQRLKSFDFSSNPLTAKAVGNITASLRGRRIDKLSLKHLYDIRHNLPLSSLTPLKQSFIQHLDLSDNSIPKLQQKSFSYLHLKTLNLSNSKINFISPSAFQGAHLLEVMDLRGNSLASVNDQFDYLTNLRVVDLSRQNLNQESDQKFSIAENSLYNLTNLEILSVNEAPFHGNITRFMFNGLVNLEKLELRRSNVRSIVGFAFETMEILRILDLSFNSIEKLSSNVFYGLENLTKLDLKKNYLTFEKSDTEFNSTDPSSPFVFLRSLKVLDLEDNCIKYLHPDILNPLTELQFLSLKHNRLKSWDIVTFSRQSTIRELSLSYNEIETVSTAMLQDFSNLGELTVLDLSDNPFNCADCTVYTFLRWTEETGTLHTDRNIVIPECVAPARYRNMKPNSSLLSVLCELTTANPASSTVSNFFEEDARQYHRVWPIWIICTGLIISVIIYAFFTTLAYRRRRVEHSGDHEKKLTFLESKLHFEHKNEKF